MIDAKEKPTKQVKPQVQHFDQIHQEIRPGQQVAFCYSGAPGIRVGTVVKLTRVRVRVAYKHKWVDHNNNVRINEWTYLSTPERVLVLSDTLPQELMMLKLKGMIP